MNWQNIGRYYVVVMMEAIENAAFISLGRASGFAGLFIFTLMVGLSFDPPVATRVGGLLGIGVWLILMLYGWRATSRPYKRTEAWMILPKDLRPPAVVAQRMIGRALHDTAFWFARRVAIVSGFLLVSSVVLNFH
ncbi:MAG: hypothetical protein NWR87_00485 [Rhodospirillales bacterium]|nr:hypothetical protein [Rhodospirillales bacterium]